MDAPKRERESVTQPLGVGPFADSAELLSVVVDHALAAVVTMDDRGIITGWGKRALEEFGWTPEEAIGRELAELIVPPQYRAAHTAGLARYRETGEGPVLGRVVELSALRRDGSEFAVELAISRAAKVGGVTTFIAFLRDITERKQAEQRQAELVAQATSATESIRDFSNLAVHELRAPLSVAKGYTEMLLDGTFGPAPERWSEPMRLISEKLAATERLVSDLLMAARIDAGGVAVASEQFDLVQLALRSAEKARSRAELEGGSLQVDTVDPMVHATGDFELTSAIVDNLVNNAIAYGGRPPEISITVSNGPQPALSVSDRGPGVAESMQARVFERFVRGANQTGAPGSGLGLYLSRRLADLQHGTLVLDQPTPGLGATFTLRLPGSGQAPTAAG